LKKKKIEIGGPKVPSMKARGPSLSTKLLSLIIAYQQTCTKLVLFLLLQHYWFSVFTLV